MKTNTLSTSLIFTKKTLKTCVSYFIHYTYTYTSIIFIVNVTFSWYTCLYHIIFSQSSKFTKPKYNIIVSGMFYKFFYERFMMIVRGGRLEYMKTKKNLYDYYFQFVWSKCWRCYIFPIRNVVWFHILITIYERCTQYTRQLHLQYRDDFS